MQHRGSIKWTSMMMPDHTEWLREMWAREEWKEKPLLAEGQIADINLQLQLALHNDLTIELEYFKNHDYQKIKGKLLGVDLLDNFVNIEETLLPLDSITGAWID